MEKMKTITMALVLMMGMTTTRAQLFKYPTNTMCYSVTIL